MDRLIDQRYRIVAELGSGGMGAVYKVEDTASGRVLALKVLSAAGERTRERLLRFRREFRAAAALDHPNIVRVHEFVSGRISYFTMEYVEGEDVAAAFGVGERARRPLRAEELNQPDRVRRLYAVLHQVLLALGYIHDRGIVHRDLKPENIVQREAPAAAAPGLTAPLVKLMDFGLARELGDTVQLTRPGVVLGTLAYLSPEQATGRAVDGRSDLYALGAVLYLLLTGTLPFAPDTASNLLWKHVAEVPEPPRSRNPGVDRFLDAACARLLRKDAFERYQTAQDLLRQLEKAGRERYQLPAEVEVVVARGTSEVGPVFRPRLVGRADPMAHLAERVEDAAHHRGGLTWLEGESGAGKSRLVAEAVDQARATGVEVAIGSFQRRDPRPYGGLAECAQDLLALARGLPAAESAQALGADSWVLADLLPPGSVPAEPGVPRLAGQARRAGLAAALAKLVQGVARSRPLVVVLDDLHHADRLARGLVDELAQVALQRPGAGGPAGRFLLLLAGDRSAAPGIGGRVLPIAALGAAHARLLAESMLGQELEASAVHDRLFALSGGLPARHEELLRLFIARGWLRFSGGRWRGEPGRIELPPATGGTELLARAQLERLADLAAPAREVVELAACCGRDLPFELLVAASGLEEAAAIDAVEQAIQERWLVEGRRLGTLAPAHEQIAEAVFAGIEGERRAALHRRLASGIEQLQGSELEPHVVELAHHAYHGNDAARAALYLPRAATRLVVLGASPEAEVVLQRIGA